MGSRLSKLLRKPSRLAHALEPKPLSDLTSTAKIESSSKQSKENSNASSDKPKIPKNFGNPKYVLSVADDMEISRLQVQYFLIRYVTHFKRYLSLLYLRLINFH